MTFSGARRGALALLAAGAALAGVAAVSGAADSDEATTFGADGIAAQSLGTHLARTAFSDVYARADGGLVAQQGHYLKSYLADGAADSAAPPMSRPLASTIFPARGGKSFLLDGERLVRLEPAGSVDSSFGGADGATVPAGTRAVTELGSGKVAAISVVGAGARNFQYYVGVTVLNADGSTARSEDLSRPVPPSYLEQPVREFVPRSDGGALVVAATFMLELRPDGSVDPGFGQAGLLSVGSFLAGAHFLADGSIEAVGGGYVSSEQRVLPALFRYTAAGKLQASFGNKGVRLFDIEGWSQAEAASWGADGSLVLGGRIEATGPCPEKDCEEAPALVAVDPAGNLDAGFGEDGVLRLSALAGPPDGYRSEGVVALTRRPDGSIIAAGNAPPNETIAFLAAISPQGTLLSSFGEDGIVRVHSPVPSTLRVKGFAPLASGKLLAAGFTDVGIAERPILVRFDSDGGLDRSFGAGSGFVSLAESGRALGLAVKGDEALVTSYGSSRSRLQMVRTDDGAPVSSFGSDGLVRLPRGILPNALAFASQGDPVVLGGRDDRGSTEPVVVLHRDRDGSPDQNFGKGGMLSLRLPGGGDWKGRALAAAPGGRILVGGIAESRFVVAGLRPDGRLDPGFGSGGWSVMRAGGPARSMTLVRDGSRLYLAGVTGGAGRSRVVLMRLRADGRPDKRFAPGGRRTVRVGSSAAPTAVLPTPEGIVVTLEKGLSPVLTFAANGESGSRHVGLGPQLAGDVQATVFGGRLVVGWSPYIDSFQAATYYLSGSPLDRRAASCQPLIDADVIREASRGHVLHPCR